MPENPSFALPESDILTEPVQPEAAIAFWQQRAKLSSKEAQALSAGARSRAFYVAGLAEMDMVDCVHSAIAEALESGETLADFKKRISPVIAAEGWKGRRVATIFRTNMQTAYSAGRYAKQQAVKKMLPYWRYVTAGDSRVRPSHAVLHGMVFPADHPFWDENYTPNGYNCHCTVQALSKGQVKRLGLEVQTEMPRAMQYTDPKTGMEYHVASPGADNGFRNNPGKDWLAGLAPQEVPFDAGVDLVQQAMCLLPKGNDFAAPHYHQIGRGKVCLPPLAELDMKHVLAVKKGDILPQGLSPEAYALAFLREFGLKSLDDSTLFTLPFLRTPLLINKNLVLDKKKQELKSDKEGRGRFSRLMAHVIKNPFEIWQVPIRLSQKDYISLRFLRLFRAEESENFGGYAALNWIGGGRLWSGATTFRPKGIDQKTVAYLERQRNGVLLFREGGGGVLQK